jgi:hypothetical protein
MKNVRAAGNHRFMSRVAQLLILVGLWAASAAADPRRIPGTSVALELPDGFEPVQGRPGLVTSSAGDASIGVQEVPAPLAELRKSVFDAEDLAARHITVQSIEYLRLSGHDVVLAQVLRQKEGTEQWMLGIGDERRSVLIFASCKQNSPKQLIDKLRAVAVSVHWPAGDPSSPLEGLPFQIVESVHLKISARVASGGLVLTDPSGPDPVRPADPVLVIGSAPALTPLGSLEEGMLEDLARSLVSKSSSYSDVKNIQGVRVRQQGLPAYELTAEATGRPEDGRIPLRIYLLVVLKADSGRYCFALGRVGASGAERAFPQFREVTHTLRMGP